MKLSVVLGMYYEDFDKGKQLVTLGRTITEADIVNFAGFTGDFNPLHTDAQYASESVWGSRIAHGMCGFSVATGLMVRLNILEGTVTAFYAIENWRFRAPIRIGDTIHVVITVAEKRESRREGQGVVALELDVLNQEGVSTMGGLIKIMMKKKNNSP